MKSLFFLVSRIAHIATARAIASRLPSKQKNLSLLFIIIIMLMDNFQGLKRPYLQQKMMKFGQQ